MHLSHKINTPPPPVPILALTITEVLTKNSLRWFTYFWETLKCICLHLQILERKLDFRFSFHVRYAALVSYNNSPYRNQILLIIWFARYSRLHACTRHNGLVCWPSRILNGGTFICVVPRISTRKKTLGRFVEKKLRNFFDVKKKQLF